MPRDVSVLLVDDEPGLLDFLLKRLQRRGFTVSTAQSGQEALVAMKADCPQVVVLDVLMPGMDGLSTLREIRRLFPQVAVLLFTAHASMEAALQGMELGAFDYLIKPVVLSELVDKIREAAGVMGGGRTWTDSREPGA